MASSGWASITIFLALLSLINSAESRLKIPPIFPPKIFATPSQQVSEGERVHPVPRTTVRVDAPSTLPSEYESLVRVHPFRKAGVHFEPVTPSPIIPENNARVHPVPRVASTRVNKSPPPMIPDNNARVHLGGDDVSSPFQTKDGDYKTFGPIMGDGVMAMAPTNI